MLAAPLYPLTKEKVPFTWTEENQKAFNSTKAALLAAQALALPDLTKPFTIYIDEPAGVACRVLTQTLGPWKRTVAYLSKKLDSVASGWPSFLKTITAVALLVKDTDKFTLGQHVIVITPHALKSVV
jgi:hypothetical protein